MKEIIYRYLKAGYPAIALRAVEERRALGEVIEAVQETKSKNLVIWSATEGMKKIHPETGSISDTEDLVSACSQKFEKTVYVFLDVHNWPLDRDPIMERSIKDLVSWAPTEGSCVIFLGADFKPRPSFQNMVTVIDFDLPGEKALNEIVNNSIESIKDGLSAAKRKDYDLELNDEKREEVVKALSGLATTEAENAVTLSFVESKAIDPAVIYREKTLAVKRSGLLELINPDPRGLEAIGGLENLKDYILKRKRAFTKEAQEYGLPAPRGIMLVGVPGTGKSLSAKAIGTALHIPTVKLDIGALFNSLVGESEARTREALKLAEAVSPCVLWIDEVEKGLSGVGGAGSGDSGTTKRVFGTILNWMQERQRPVFLVATANAVHHLPPEFIRRWDEVFAVDLPTENEREAIFNIHIKNNRRDPSKFKMDSLIAASKDYTGAEIEKAVIAAMYTSFDDGGREIETKDIVQALNDLCPVSKTMKQQIDAMREQIGTRFRRACAVKESTIGKTAKRKLDV